MRRPSRSRPGRRRADRGRFIISFRQASTGRGGCVSFLESGGERDGGEEDGLAPGRSCSGGVSSSTFAPTVPARRGTSSPRGARACSSPRDLQQLSLAGTGPSPRDRQHASAPVPLMRCAREAGPEGQARSIDLDAEDCNPPASRHHAGVDPGGRSGRAEASGRRKWQLKLCIRSRRPPPRPVSQPKRPVRPRTRSAEKRRRPVRPPARATEAASPPGTWSKAPPSLHADPTGRGHVPCTVSDGRSASKRPPRWPRDIMRAARRRACPGRRALCRRRRPARCRRAAAS